MHELHHAEVTTGDVKAMIQGYDPFGSAEVSVRNEEFVQAGFQLGERLRVSVSDAKRVILDKEILYERYVWVCAKRRRCFVSRFGFICYVVVKHFCNTYG